MAVRTGTKTAVERISRVLDGWYILTNCPSTVCTFSVGVGGYLDTRANPCMFRLFSVIELK